VLEVGVEVEVGVGVGVGELIERRLQCRRRRLYTHRLSSIEIRALDAFDDDRGEEFALTYQMVNPIFPQYSK
jgi:hypothetical protein